MAIDEDRNDLLTRLLIELLIQEVLLSKMSGETITNEDVED